jgi:hypothetical protein
MNPGEPDENSVDLDQLNRLNRTSWAMVRQECERLEKSLAEKRITIDQLILGLQRIDPAAKEQLDRISHAVKEVFSLRQSMDEYFQGLASSLPASAPIRFRRMNRA